MKKSILALTVPLLLASNLIAFEIDDAEFGFRCSIPDNFIATPNPPDPNTLYLFLDRTPTPGNPAIVVQIQRLHSLINADTRLIETDIPKAAGTKTNLEPFEWNGRTVDSIRQIISHESGVAYAVFTIQYPLSYEAVQLQIGGPIDQEDQVRQIFEDVAAKFTNVHPLHHGASSPPNTRPGFPSVERTTHLIKGFGILVIAIIVIILLLRKIGGTNSESEKG